MNHKIATVGICFLLVFAGCAGTGTSPDATTGPSVSTAGETTETPTTTSTDGAQTTARPLSDVAFPAGLAASGFTDREAFFRNFFATLRNGSDYRLETTTTFDTDIEYATTTRVDTSEKVVSTLMRENGSEIATAYFNGSRLYGPESNRAPAMFTRVTTADGAEYSGGQSSYDAVTESTAPGFSGFNMFELLRILTVEPRDVVVQDGTQLLVLNVTGLTQADAGTAGGSILVDADGRIHEYEVTISLNEPAGFITPDGRSFDAEEISDEFHLTLTPVTIDRPDWVDTAATV